MKWILILMMWQAGYAGGSMATAEFNTEEACKAAGAAVVTTEHANVKAYCYPAGGE